MNLKTSSLRHKRLTIAHNTIMKKRALHSLFACLCESALALCGSQRALHFDHDGARESPAVDTSDVHRL